MKTKIARWGNSLALRIPKRLTESHQLTEGTDLEIIEMENELRIRPLISNRYELSELLNKITDENLHGEQLSDSPRGKEHW